MYLFLYHENIICCFVIVIHKLTWRLCVLQLILAAVGSGLYVYSILTKTVVAYRKVAHDSNVLHTMLLSDR